MKLQAGIFLSLSYFDEHSLFLRHHEIDRKFFISQPEIVIFISHEWEITEHPDPIAYQFRLTKHLINRLMTPIQSVDHKHEGLLRGIHQDRIGFFYDYSSLHLLRDQFYLQQKLMQLHRLHRKPIFISHEYFGDNPVLVLPSRQ